jgi:hypothetical protein
MGAHTGVMIGLPKEIAWGQQVVKGLGDLRDFVVQHYSWLIGALEVLKFKDENQCQDGVASVKGGGDVKVVLFAEGVASKDVANVDGNVATEWSRQVSDLAAA